MTKKLATKLKPRHPRPYLSWTQQDLWERSPDEYVRRYIFDEQGRLNMRMSLGKQVHEVLETNEEQEDRILEHLRIMAPYYPEREYEIKVETFGIPLLGKLDGFNPTTLSVGENKTGKLWDLKRAQEHRQMDFYALLVYAKFGHIPSKMALHWIPTILDEQDGELKPTGDVKTFPVVKTMNDVLKIAADATRAWKEIGERCAKEYSYIGL